jgi:hypothetical protein
MWAARGGFARGRPGSLRSRVAVHAVAGEWLAHSEAGGRPVGSVVWGVAESGPAVRSGGATVLVGEPAEDVDAFDAAERAAHLGRRFGRWGWHVEV